MTDKYAANFAALKNLTKPKAIIFDWDNTLVDTWPLIHTAIDTTMIEMGKEPWGFDKVRDNVHKSMRESFPEIFGNEWQKAGEIYKNAYRAIHLDKMRFLPDALNLINEIAKTDILQFVVSNKIGASLRKEAAKLEVDKKFFAVVGAGDAIADKPSSEPVELALLGSDLDPKKDEIWFVGDTIADIECAYNSNCRPVIFGQDLGTGAVDVSKTIPDSLVRNGKNGEGALPLYNKHKALIEIITKF